ncbi:MAG: type and secretion system protein [Gammaproteobacteria bacterium]|jgi:type IV pilus assembly protein PilQ|nr:type and secretion system protein [Gammaproteobacteria bacterium]
MKLKWVCLHVIFWIFCGLARMEGLAQTQLISLNFQNIPVRTLLQIVAEFAHNNVVSSDAVQGNISIHLEKVSWQQALTIILQSQNLAKREIAGAWYVAPQSVIMAQTKMAEQLNEQSQENLPLKTQYFQLHYANSSEVTRLLKQTLPGSVHIIADQRSNILIVKANQVQLAEIKAVLNKIDIPLNQVLLKAKIAVIDQSALKELGVVLRNNSDNDLMQRLPGGGDETLAFQIVHLPSGRSIDLELQALEAEGQAEVISSPKLLVSDNQKAYIEQGNEIPFQTSTSSGATQIEFKKAVLGLQVIPHITDKHQIFLNLQVNDDDISNEQSPAGEVPIVATSELKTNVLLADGQTVVLGGIHVVQVMHDKRGVPILGSIPVIGWLFKHSSDESRKSELVVFITPSIIKTGINPTSSLKFTDLKRNNNEKIA